MDTNKLGVVELLDKFEVECCVEDVVECFDEVVLECLYDNNKDDLMEIFPYIPLGIYYRGNPGWEIFIPPWLYA